MVRCNKSLGKAFRPKILFYLWAKYAVNALSFPWAVSIFSFVYFLCGVILFLQNQINRLKIGLM